MIKRYGKRIRAFFRCLGPGLITGAADDDPSGVATYSVAGAQLGTQLLWTAFFTWPLMAVVQMMCARIGMVTGQGLAGVFRKKFPKPVIALIAFGLFGANTLNIGADLSGMADAAQMLTGIHSHWFVVPLAGVIVVVTIRYRYYQIANVLKWLCLILLAYVITAFNVVKDWRPLLRDTFIPAWPKSHETWAMLVAILGTTISPYLFFWQASQEVEEEKAKGRRMVTQRLGATKKELFDRKLDVGTGTFFSNLVMYFIIVTTVFTLHRHGFTKIETSKQAAEALAPLAGRFAAMLYTFGIVGVGLLAIPVLAGSAAYALSEVFDWRQGLDEKFDGASEFYIVVIVSTSVGVLFDFLGVNVVKALYWSAIINGLLAPFLLVAILVVASDRNLMQNQPSSRLSRSIVLAATILMFVAAIGMFVF